MNLHTSTARPPADVWRDWGAPSDIRRDRSVTLVAVSGALAGISTSSSEETRVLDLPYDVVSFTTAGTRFAPVTEYGHDASAESTRQAINELRRISGLTWEQLGSLFSVSRRSVHFWASGRSLSAENERRLLRVLDVVRRAYRGDSRSTRTALLEAEDGLTALGLLGSGRYDKALARLGVGVGPSTGDRTPLSEAALAARLPERPERLVGARNEAAHKELSGKRSATTSRNKRRDGT